jgi:hypothetical protein
LITLISGSDRVDVYSLAAPGPAKSVLAFRPYDGDKNGAAVKFAAAVSPEQLITVSQSGRLVLWQLAGAKAVYEMAVKSDDFEFSPNRKQLAFSNGAGVSIIDPATGQVLASLSENPGQLTQLAFSPDGARLAHFAAQPYARVTVYDLATGKTVGDCTLPKDAWTGQVAFAGPAHVLVAGYLCEPAKRLVVWRYAPDPFSPKARGGQPDDRYWAFVKGEFRQPSALVPVVLPHDEAKKLIANLNPNDLLIVRPGVKVAVTASVTGDAAFQKKVLDHLTERATAAGLVVDPAAPIRLTATTTAKAARTMQYHVIGGNPANQTVSIPSYECKVTLTDGGGQTLWDVGAPAGNLQPTFAHLKAGQTVQQLVDEINANPGNGFYTNLSIPGAIGRPLDQLQTSTITMKGPQPAR